MNLHLAPISHCVAPTNGLPPPQNQHHLRPLTQFLLGAVAPCGPGFRSNIGGRDQDSEAGLGFRSFHGFRQLDPTEQTENEVVAGKYARQRGEGERE